MFDLWSSCCHAGGAYRQKYPNRTRKWLRWRGPAAVVNDRPVISSERERPTSTNPQMSDSNKNLVVSPRWVLYSKLDWPTDRLRIRLRLYHVTDCLSTFAYPARSFEDAATLRRHNTRLLRNLWSCNEWVWSLMLTTAEALACTG
jgi:hypothetical protein